MSSNLYSLVLSCLVVALGIAMTTLLVGYFLIPTVRRRICRYDYYFYIAGIGGIGAISTLGALTYQFIYGFEVCVLCWWQRIFMFPIEVIAFFSLMFRERATHYITATLSFGGVLFAGYHYFNHFQNLILDKDVVLPCGTIGLVPSCSEFSFTYFGFLTLPFMALVAFIAIMILSFFAHQSQSRD